MEVKEWGLDSTNDIICIYDILKYTVKNKMFRYTATEKWTKNDMPTMSNYQHLKRNKILMHTKLQM